MMEILAKDITDCDNCPLCINGQCEYPISYKRPEPPCASWTDDMEIYKGMYDFWWD